jgi:hypothetical protein
MTTSQEPLCRRGFWHIYDPTKGQTFEIFRRTKTFPHLPAPPFRTACDVLALVFAVRSRAVTSTCGGLLTSSGTCIGSESNVEPDSYDGVTVYRRHRDDDGDRQRHRDRDDD